MFIENKKCRLKNQKSTNSFRLESKMKGISYTWSNLLSEENYHFFSNVFSSKKRVFFFSKTKISTLISCVIEIVIFILSVRSTWCISIHTADTWTNGTLRWIVGTVMRGYLVGECMERVTTSTIILHRKPLRGDCNNLFQWTTWKQ